MNLLQPTPLLGGLSCAAFMRTHWHKAPLLVRQALPGGLVLLPRKALFALAAREDVESRLVWREPQGGAWQMRHGPLARRALPPIRQDGWTLLVQGLDLHLDAAAALLERFTFIPRARLDDLMLSYATHGGGVGPHVDAYDVFLLQAQGRRRWRIAPPGDAAFKPGLPLKILKRFKPTQEWLLEPGDMLYLPPGWAHDGVAEGECLTASVGFRAQTPAQVAAELLQRLADACESDAAQPPYADPAQAATAQPARMPAALQAFAARAVRQALAQPQALACALGEWLTEPKPKVTFEVAGEPKPGSGLRLDRRSKMLYDDAHLFINGEAFECAGRDALLLRQLADERHLGAAQAARLSLGARRELAGWVQAGWVQETRHDAI